MRNISERLSILENLIAFLGCDGIVVHNEKVGHGQVIVSRRTCCRLLLSCLLCFGRFRDRLNRRGDLVAVFVIYCDFSEMFRIDQEGRLRRIDEIHQDIWQAVRPLLETKER